MLYRGVNMHASGVERLVEGCLHSRALAEVDRILHCQCRLEMRVLLRQEGRALEVYPPPERGKAAGFCAVVRKYPLGRNRCATCQTLILLSASFNGLIEYSCHGGVSILAAPARLGPQHISDYLVIKSSGFLRERSPAAWRTVARHLKELAVSGGDARAAYEGLPVLSDDQVAGATQLITIAAAVAGDIEYQLRAQNRWAPDHGNRTAQGKADAADAFSAALTCYDDANNRIPGPATGNRLIDLVVAVVTRNPGMEFTLTNIARAAHLTPNHLSTLFHRHAGIRFTDFLLEQRLNAAMRHLEDFSLSVAEVARQCGFNNVSYFCKCFRRHTGLTPGQWRRHHAPRDTGAFP
jgi:AraC-like DNA-binding protein